MTSVDPSHLPSRRLHANDRRNAQAVHTSISPITNEAKQALKREADHLSSNDDEDGRVSGESEDDEAVDDESGHMLSRHRRRRERRERARRKAEMKRGRIPAPPVPDLRFEQGVLLSIRPYLHSTPSSSSQGNVESPLDEKRRKRRHGEENVAIVSASFTAEGADKQVDNDLFQPGLRIEWSKVVYVLLRDQIVFPLLQGIGWSIGGLGLTAFWKWQGLQSPTSKASSSSKGQSGKLGKTPLAKLFGTR